MERAGTDCTPILCSLRVIISGGRSNKARLSKKGEVGERCI